ncbi:hypothetical protein DRO54_11660 [Candidatus Bathyarchaeota archaeon]|nr:MAG: hypothetical protein DRO54_11660 [Candidatus Bathyarchaeota archaeon]
MIFDITVPAFLFLLCFIAVKVYEKFGEKLKSTFEERELQVKDVIVLVVIMGVMISIMVMIPAYALVILFLLAFSMLTFTFSIIVTGKWYISIILPVIFISLYYFGVFWNIPYLWNIYVIDVFVMIFAILITVYLGGLFTWKATVVFAVLLTIMDIIQVLFTGHMVEVSYTAVEYQLPLLVFLPILPPIYVEQGLRMMGLGLGDLFFAGLLSLQLFRRMGYKSAMFSMVGISISFFIFEALLLTYEIAAFPGTLMIICGWLPAMLSGKVYGKNVE